MSQRRPIRNRRDPNNIRTTARHLMQLQPGGRAGQDFEYVSRTQNGPSLA
jgi:hypothetical protein